MYSTEDSTRDPKYRKVNLQWFADEDGAGGDDDKVDESDDDDKIKELEKELKLSKKESAGKDAKISKLLEADKIANEVEGKKKERERKAKQEDFGNMSDESLRNKFEQMQEDADRRVEEVENNNRAEIEKMQYKSNILNAISEVDNLDPVIASTLIKTMTMDRSVDNQDEIKDKIQSCVDTINSQTKKQKYIFDNIDKVRSRPGAGTETDTTKTPSERGWHKMSVREQKVFSENASNEQLEKLEKSGYK